MPPIYVIIALALATWALVIGLGWLIWVLLG